MKKFSYTLILYTAKQIGFLLVAGMSVITVSCSQPERPAKPNILFIMADDHAFQAISAYGSGLIQTPNIDRLAQEGIRFDRAFVTNSICSPSRAVILTGKFSHLNGLRDNVAVFDSTQQTFPKLLQKAGYETAVIGKWHLKSEPTGFDFWKVLRDQGDYYQPEFKTPEGLVEEKGYVTDVITDLAIDWLENKRDRERPFLLLCQHKAPHREWLPAQQHLDEFMTWDIPEPSSLADDYANRGTAAKEAEMRILDHMGYSSDHKIPPDSVEKLGVKEFQNWYKPVYFHNYNRMTADEKKHWKDIYNPVVDKFMKDSLKGNDLLKWRYQRYMQDYLATIRSVDESVGKILSWLDEHGLADNTIVVYTSDQGFYLGEHGWFDKRFMYEESFRTPLIMRWPDWIKPGKVDPHLVQNLDFAGTFLELAGVNIPNDMQGESLIPLFRGKSPQWRDALYYHYYEYPGIHAVKRHYGIRTDRYKLIHFYYDIDEWEMYDLLNDPHEMNNIYNKPEFQNTQLMLTAKLDSLRANYRDSDSLTSQILEQDLTILEDSE
ncbi:MAG: sulfatase [Bacteroidales bacterium]|nr:sulfatase [Bacteroidales bacterium]